MQREAGCRVPIGWLKGGQRVQRESERVQAVRGRRQTRARRDKHGRETRDGHIRARAQNLKCRMHVVANRHPRMCLTRGGAPMR